MARISEFEVLAEDTIELALTPAEYDAMIAAGGTITYNASLYQHNGTHYRDFAFPTTASGYQLDPETNEYIAIITYPTGTANFFTTPDSSQALRYEGIGLYSNNAGTVTPIEGYYVHSDSANPALYDLTPNGGPMVGTTFKLVNLGTIPTTGSGSVRWDYPKRNEPFLGNADFYNTGIICFAKGTLIETPDGMKDVSDLKAGDQVKTLDNGYQSIRWTGSRKIEKSELEANPRLYPVRISAGSLGVHLPSHDVLVSRQHRVLVNLNASGANTEVLVAAVKLTKLPGIYVDDSVGAIEYFHILCDNHEIVFAENLQAETLFTGVEALKTMSPEALEEINAILPQLSQADYQPKPARQLASGLVQKQLVEQHLERLAHA